MEEDPSATTNITITTTTTTTTNITISTTTATTTPKSGVNGIRRLRSTQKICGEVPQWVKVMIDIRYNVCEIHSDAKDNRLDRFCINCVGSFCNQCSSNHEGHTHIKIRRYVYNDVIKRPDFQKHFDCSGIQGYMTNKNKVLFLKQRRENQEVKEQQQQQNARSSCIICNRTLIDAFYCSIQCKIAAMKSVNTEAVTVDNNNVTKVKVELSEAGGLQNNVNTEVAPVDANVNTDEAAVDNNVNTDVAAIDKDVNTEEDTIKPSKKTRKGNPQRAPLF